MTPQDVKTPHPQLDKKAIQELIRPHVPKMIEQALAMVKNADNDSVKLGAIKLLLAKVVPDLKAVDMTDEEGKSIIEKIVIVRSDGNKTEPVAGSGIL